MIDSDVEALILEAKRFLRSRNIKVLYDKGNECEWELVIDRGTCTYHTSFLNHWGLLAYVQGFREGESGKRVE